MPTILILAVVSTLVMPAAAAPQDQVYKPGNGVTTPTVVKDVKPNYTPDALRRRVQGMVGLSCVVRADGTVGECTVTRPLDAELDRAAVGAAKQWHFRPGTKDGEPVAVEVSIDMSFTTGDGPPVYRPGSGITSPVVVREVKPDYPEEIKRAGIEGTVELEGIVQTDGTIGSIRVRKGIDERLDREAAETLSQWRFKPGQKDGENVRVLVLVEMSFSVR